MCTGALSNLIPPPHGDRDGSIADAASRPLVAIVDDSRAFFLAWRLYLRGAAEVVHAASPAAFREMIAARPDVLPRLRAVVIDYRFPDSSEDGISFARELRVHHVGLQLVLSSCTDFTATELGDVFDLVVDKTPVPLIGLAS